MDPFTTRRASGREGRYDDVRLLDGRFVRPWLVPRRPLNCSWYHNGPDIGVNDRDPTGSSMTIELDSKEE